MNPFVYSRTAANCILKQNKADSKQIETAARSAANSLGLCLSYDQTQALAECFISGVNSNDAKAVLFSLMLLKHCGLSRMCNDLLAGKAAKYIYSTPAKGRQPMTAPQHWFKKYYEL